MPEFKNTPHDGYYDRIAWFLLEGFINDTLPGYLYEDLALANKNIMGSINGYVKKYVAKKGKNNPLTQRVLKMYATKPKKAEACAERIFAIRLIPKCTDSSNAALYTKLKEEFLGIKNSGKDFWRRNLKKYITSALPYFIKEYQNDYDLQKRMFFYFLDTQKDQVQTTLSYFGGAANWPQGFKEALVDPKRIGKNWVYIWSFSAICKEGKHFPPETINELKSVIESYHKKNEQSLNLFEKDIVKEALSV